MENQTNGNQADHTQQTNDLELLRIKAGYDQHTSPTAQMPSMTVKF